MDIDIRRRQLAIGGGGTDDFRIHLGQGNLDSLYRGDRAPASLVDIQSETLGRPGMAIAGLVAAISLIMVIVTLAIASQSGFLQTNTTQIRIWISIFSMIFMVGPASILIPILVFVRSKLDSRHWLRSGIQALCVLIAGLVWVYAGATLIIAFRGW